MRCDSMNHQPHPHLPPTSITHIFHPPTPATHPHHPKLPSPTSTSKAITHLDPQCGTPQRLFRPHDPLQDVLGIRSTVDAARAVGWVGIPPSLLLLGVVLVVVLLLMLVLLLLLLLLVLLVLVLMMI